MTTNQLPIGSEPDPDPQPFIEPAPPPVPPAVFMHVPSRAYAGVPAEFRVSVDRGTTWVWRTNHWEARPAVTYNQINIDIPGVANVRDHRDSVNQGTTAHITVPGAGTYGATATGFTTGGQQVHNGPRMFTVTNPTNPVFDLVSPAANAPVNLGPNGGSVEVRVTSAADQIYPWTITITRDGITTSEQYNGNDYRRTVTLGPTPVGPRTITVTCSDPANRQTTASRTVIGQDSAPPNVTINPFDPSPTVPSLPFVFVVTGTTPGAASGVTGVQYAVTDGPSGPAENTSPNGDWSTWRATILLPTTGTFNFTITATNTRGTTRSAQGTVSPHL